MSSPAKEEPSERRLGRFVLGERIAAGGMATVYAAAAEAGHALAGRALAIKVLHDHLGEDPDFVRMFRDEGRIATRLEHPHIVRVHAVGEDAGRHYLVMDRVIGKNLARIQEGVGAAKRKIPRAAATGLLRPVLLALDHVHRAAGRDGRPLGLVHRDVSPSNVLLAASGHAKLIDFGIASALVREHESTAGHVLGKLRYAAPEQLRRDAVDARADVYALGVLLWEMLTCEPLFSGGHDALSGERPPPAPPSRHAPEVSAGLDRVVLDALAADREQRIASARALRDALCASTRESTAIGAPELATMLEALVGDELASAAEELPAEARTSPGAASARALERTTLPRVAPAPVVVREAKPVTRADRRARWVTIALVIGGLLVGVLAGALAAR